MSARLVVLAATVFALTCCARHTAQDDELPSEPQQLSATWREAGATWDRLSSDLAAGRFWTAGRYRGERIRFDHQPVFDAQRNPVLVSIYRTPIWCHVRLKPAEFEQLQRDRAEVDSLTLGVIGRVESINWYKKHIVVRSLRSHADGGQ